MLCVTWQNVQLLGGGDSDGVEWGERKISWVWNPPAPTKFGKYCTSHNYSKSSPRKWQFSWWTSRSIGTNKCWEMVPHRSTHGVPAVFPGRVSRGVSPFGGIGLIQMDWSNVCVGTVHAPSDRYQSHLHIYYRYIYFFLGLISRDARGSKSCFKLCYTNVYNVLSYGDVKRQGRPLHRHHYTVCKPMSQSLRKAHFPIAGNHPSLVLR